MVDSLPDGVEEWTVSRGNQTRIVDERAPQNEIYAGECLHNLTDDPESVFKSSSASTGNLALIRQLLSKDESSVDGEYTPLRDTDEYPDVIFPGHAIDSHGDSLEVLPITYRDLRQNTLVTGSSGYGRASLLENIFGSAARQGRGGVLVDSRGELSQSLLNSIPEDRLDDVYVISEQDLDVPSDCTEIDGLNVLGSGPEDMHTGVFRQYLLANLSEEMKRQVSGFKGIKWQKSLDDLLRFAIERDGFNFSDFATIVPDPQARLEFLDEHSEDESVQQFMSDLDATPETLYRRLWHMLPPFDAADVSSFISSEDTANPTPLASALDEDAIVLVDTSPIESQEDYRLVARCLTHRLMALARTRQEERKADEKVGVSTEKAHSTKTLPIAFTETESLFKTEDDDWMDSALFWGGPLNLGFILDTAFPRADAFEKAQTMFAFSPKSESFSARIARWMDEQPLQKDLLELSRYRCVVSLPTDEENEDGVERENYKITTFPPFAPRDIAEHMGE